MHDSRQWKGVDGGMQFRLMTLVNILAFYYCF